MTQTCTTAGKKALMSVMAAFAACILTMSCSTPAFAKEDPGWGATEYAYNNSAGGTNTANTDGNNNAGGSTGGDAGTGNNESGETSEDSSNDNSSDNASSGGNSNSAESGFTTPGNGNLGDQIKGSNGKDFYTVHTKNNNTFYLVIDHANSTENVYMLSLIDENDLSEFLKESAGSNETAAPPVIIPETKPQTDSPEADPDQTETKQPQAGPSFQSYFPWILIVVLAFAGGFYYLKIYKPGQEEETDTSEGMETEDFPTESEE